MPAFDVHQRGRVLGVDEHLAAEIAWSVIDSTIGKTELFIREFQAELKKGPDPLCECSSWVHQLLDHARSGLNSLPDHLPLANVVRESIQRFKSDLQTFVEEVDEKLGVERRRVFNSPDNPKSAIGAVVSDTRLFLKKLQSTVKDMEQSLPAATLSRLQNRPRIKFE